MHRSNEISKENNNSSNSQSLGPLDAVSERTWYQFITIWNLRATDRMPRRIHLAMDACSYVPLVLELKCFITLYNL